MSSIITARLKSVLFQQGWALPILAGILLGLSVPGIGLWELAWVGLVPALFGLKFCKSWLHAFWHGLIFGKIYHGMLFWWFWGLHPLTWMGLSPMWSHGVTAMAWGTATAVQALIVAIIWVAVYACYKKWGLTGLLVTPLLWVCGLWFLNQQPLGLPWGFLAYTQASATLCRNAVSHLSFLGFEALIIMVNVMLFMLWQIRHVLLKNPWQWSIRLGITVFLLAGLAFVSPVDDGVYKKLMPVAIQGNLSIEEERLGVTPAMRNHYYQTLIDQALRENPNTRLIVLPEGVVTMDHVTSQSPFHIPPHVALLTGGIYRTSAGFYNGALLFQQNQPVQILAKRILVPFGETTPILPGTWVQAWLKPLGIDYSLGFQRASFDQKPFMLDGTGIGPLICFEALYPDIVARYRQQGVKLLVTFSNLGWYHQNAMLERQFLAINQLRAVESGTPLILITNTGVSAFIDSRGQILMQSASGKRQILAFQNAGIPR